MGDRPQLAENAGAGNQAVDPPETGAQRRTQLGHGLAVGEIERHQGRVPTSRPHGIVDLFQRADRARQQHQMDGGAGQGQGGRPAETARGTADHDDAAGRAGRVARRQPAGLFAGLSHGASSLPAAAPALGSFGQEGELRLAHAVGHIRRKNGFV